MLYQAGLNHIFDDGTLCFCLVCKDNVTENYPLDRHSAICQHFRSENHEKNTRSLFKICVPDPKCESRNVRYLDIVINSEFEVWDQGKEPSYVTKKHNIFFCLICKKEVSKVSEETDKTKRNLQYHLESELHLDNVKNSIWCTYHPNLDSNYIALNKIFMYCSFCQKILVSKENCLLKFAADHIETELNKANSNRTSNSKVKVINFDSVSITELKNANSTDVITQMLNRKTKLLKAISDNVSNSQFEPGLKPIPSTSGHITDNLQLDTTKINEVGTNRDSSIHYKVSSVKATDEVKGSCKSLDCEGLACSDIFNSNISEEEVIVCPTCQEQVEILNGDILFSMQKHSQKHKDLSLINKNIEMETQTKTSFECHLCDKQIEVFTKSALFSFKYHYEKYHPDHGNSFSSIENAKDQKSQNLLFAKAFSVLPNDLRDHLIFVAFVGETLMCMLCSRELSSSRAVTNSCDIFLNHFSELYHKSQYKAYAQKDTGHVEDDQEFEENIQFFRDLKFNRGKIDQTRSPGFLVKNISSEQKYTNKEKLKVPDKKFSMRIKVLETLFQLTKLYPEVNKNVHILDEKEGNFCCQPCGELLEFTPSGRSLVKHLHEEDHIERSHEQVKGKVRERAQVLNILNELSRCCKVIMQNIEDVGEKNGRFFCKCCDAVIMCSLSGQKLVDHLKGPGHHYHVATRAELQRELLKEARPAEQVIDILHQLASIKVEVKRSIKVLDERQGHFYCKVCDKILLFTVCGNNLSEHLRGRKHVFNLLEHQSNSTSHSYV